tara:strand:+ start:5122 stop:5352 length:231 start_codon:yes stop_codon:yes gene_type:complete
MIYGNLGNEFTKAGYAWDSDAQRDFSDSLGGRVARNFATARKEIEAAGRKIYDCTPDGRLTKSGALEYMPLEEALA